MCERRKSPAILERERPESGRFDGARRREGEKRRDDGGMGGRGDACGEAEL